MRWPQIVWLSIAVIALLIASNEHGKPKTGEHNFFAAAIGIGISAWLLWCGGFFG